MGRGGGEGGRRLSCGGRPRRGLFICSLVGEAHPVLECVCVCVQDACLAKYVGDVPCVRKNVMGILQFSLFTG